MKEGKDAREGICEPKQPTPRISHRCASELGLSSGTGFVEREQAGGFYHEPALSGLFQYGTRQKG